MTQKFRITLDLEIFGMKETTTVAELQDAVDFQVEMDGELVPHHTTGLYLENIEELS